MHDTRAISRSYCGYVVRCGSEDARREGIARERRRAAQEHPLDFSTHLYVVQEQARAGAALAHMAPG